MKWQWLLLLLVACAPTQSHISPDTFTGTEGVKVAFNQFSPKQLIMCQQANIVVDVQNLGTSDVNGGKYSFVFEEQVLKPATKEKSFSLEGKSQINPRGMVDQIVIPIKSSALGANFKSYTTPITVRACYPYTTTAVVPVCVDSTLGAPDKSKVCVPAETVLTLGQGAPVAVTKVRPTMMPEANGVRPSFEINVKQVGSGQVVNAESASSCQGVSQVIPIVRLQDEVLDCKIGRLKVEPARDAMMVCESSKVITGTFETPLVIELQYGFVSSAKMDVTVARSSGQASC